MHVEVERRGGRMLLRRRSGPGGRVSTQCIDREGQDAIRYLAEQSRQTLRFEREIGDRRALESIVGELLFGTVNREKSYSLVVPPGLECLPLYRVAAAVHGAERLLRDAPPLSQSVAGSAPETVNAAVRMGAPYRILGIDQVPEHYQHWLVEAEQASNACSTASATTLVLGRREHWERYVDEIIEVDTQAVDLLVCESFELREKILAKFPALPVWATPNLITPVYAAMIAYETITQRNRIRLLGAECGLFGFSSFLY